MEVIFMETNITHDTICTPSDDVVARKSEGEIVIVPLVSGIGDADDEFYTLNETGQAIWQKLDGQRTRKAVASDLASEFSSPKAELENDVLGFVCELTRMGMLVAKR